MTLIPMNPENRSEYLVELSFREGGTILCRSELLKREYMTIAENMGLNIPEPVTYMEFLYGQIERDCRYVIIEDAESFMEFAVREISGRQVSKACIGSSDTEGKRPSDTKTPVVDTPPAENIPRYPYWYWYPYSDEYPNNGVIYCGYPNYSSGTGGYPGYTAPMSSAVEDTDTEYRKLMMKKELLPDIKWDSGGTCS